MKPAFVYCDDEDNCEDDGGGEDGGDGSGDAGNAGLCETLGASLYAEIANWHSAQIDYNNAVDDWQACADQWGPGWPVFCGIPLSTLLATELFLDYADAAMEDTANTMRFFGCL
jgi:hypothetical protein